MTPDEIFREYVKQALNFLPQEWQRVRPDLCPPNIDRGSVLRILIEVQGAALAHVLQKLEAEREVTKSFVVPHNSGDEYYIAYASESCKDLHEDSIIAWEICLSEEVVNPITVLRRWKEETPGWKWAIHYPNGNYYDTYMDFVAETEEELLAHFKRMFELDIEIEEEERKDREAEAEAKEEE